MEKNELINKLMAIKSQYIDEQPLVAGMNNIVVKEFADCLDHPQIEKYLLDTGIVPNEEVLKEALPLYKTAENIIEAFAESYFMLEDVGLVRLKMPSTFT